MLKIYRKTITIEFWIYLIQCQADVLGHTPCHIKNSKTNYLALASLCNVKLQQ